MQRDSNSACQCLRDFLRRKVCQLGNVYEKGSVWIVLQRAVVNIFAEVSVKHGRFRTQSCFRQCDCRKQTSFFGVNLPPSIRRRRCLQLYCFVLEASIELITDKLHVYSCLEHLATSVLAVRLLSAHIRTLVVGGVSARLEHETPRQATHATVYHELSREGADGGEQASLLCL